MQSTKRTIPFHTFLLAIFPALTLYISNVHILRFSMIWATLAVMVVVAALLLFAGRLLFKDIKKGAILASLVVVLITHYGNYQDRFLDVRIPFFFKPIRMDQNFYLWSSLVLLVLCWYVLRRMKTSPVKPTKILNIVSLVLVATSFFASGASLETASGADEDLSVEQGEILQLTSASATMPDIYYFVMDAYGRADILKEMYDFDNSEFLGYLKAKGFYIADSSTSNYGQTILSIPSALNMQYADEIAKSVGTDSENRKPLRKWLLNNRTINSLKAIGYKVAATDASIFDLVTYNEGVDVFYSTPGTNLNLYENHYLNTTIVKAFNKRKALTVLDSYGMHRKKILHAFKRIKKVPRKKGTYFVYGHILAPHQPFVFGKNGEELNPGYEYGIWKPREDGFELEAYRQGYINQLQFVNKKLTEIIDHILEHSKQPPIIIIQGDHGPASEVMNINGLDNNNFKERLSILNAYYFPDRDYSHLYDTISPVNSFRVILNQYFGTNLEPIPDKAMYSSWYRPYEFVDVTDSIR